MAERVEIFTVTCNAGVTQAAPKKTDVSFPPGEVARIEIVIPPGHAFTTGIAIAVAHQIVIPNSGSSWLSDDNRTLTFDTENYPQSGSWQVFTFNDGKNPHTWYLRFHVVELRNAPQFITPTPIRPSAIYDAMRD